MRLRWVFLFLFVLSGCFKVWEPPPIIKVNNEVVSSKEFSQKLIQKLSEYDPLLLKNVSLVEKIKNDLVLEQIEELLVCEWIHSNPALENSAPATPAEKFLFCRQKLIEALQQQKPLEEEEIALFFNKNKDFFAKDKIHLRHIFLKTKVDADHVVEALRARRLKFIEAAQQYSQSPESQQLGDWGWHLRGESPLIDAAFKLPTGPSLQIFSSPQGFHLLEVLEVKKAAALHLKDVRDEVVRVMKERGAVDLYQAWLRERTKNSKIWVDQDQLTLLKANYQETL